MTMRAACPAGLTKARGALNYRSGDVAIAPQPGRRRPVEGADQGAMNMTNMDNVTVTERAARRIGEILGREPPGTMLRLRVEGGGCSGFQYKFDVDRERMPEDV